MNLVLGSNPLGWAISLVGVVVFTVYTAYDVQRIAYGTYVTVTGSVEKASVLGAIHLYINFVNLFLFLLRLMGGAPLAHSPKDQLHRTIVMRNTSAMRCIFSEESKKKLWRPCREARALGL